MSGRPALLLLCRTLPYPVSGAIRDRKRRLLESLAGVFDVTALCFYRWRDRSMRSRVEEDIGAFRQLVQVEAFPIPREHNPVRRVWDRVRSLAALRQASSYAYRSRDFAARLRELLQGTPFHLIHSDNLDLAMYLPMLSGAPIVCLHHGVHSQRLSRRAARETVAWRRRYLARLARHARRREQLWCERSALNVTPSAAEQEVLRRLAPGARFRLFPEPIAVGGDGLGPENGREADSRYEQQMAIASLVEEYLRLIEATDRAPVTVSAPSATRPRTTRLAGQEQA